MIENKKDILKLDLPLPIIKFFIEAFDNGATIESNKIITPIIKHPDFHYDARFMIGYYSGVLCAWYVFKDHCERSLGTIELDTYDNIIKLLTHLANVCPNCHYIIGATKLKSYGFASFACENCYDKAYAIFKERNGDNWWK